MGLDCFHQRSVLKRLAEGPILFVSYTLPSEGDGEPFPVQDVTGRTCRVRGTFAALSFYEGMTWPVRKLIPRNMGTPGESDVSGYLSCVQTPDGLIHMLNSSRYYRFNLAWLSEHQGATC